MPPTMLVTLVVPAAIKPTLPRTSQSPAVRESEVTFTAVPVVAATGLPDVTAELINSPSRPAAALSLVAVVVATRVSLSRASLPAAAVEAVVPIARNASSLVAALPEGLSEAATFAAVTLASIGVRVSLKRASLPAAACVAPLPNVRRLPVPAAASVARLSFDSAIAAAVAIAAFVSPPAATLASVTVASVGVRVSLKRASVVRG